MSNSVSTNILKLYTIIDLVYKFKDYYDNIIMNIGNEDVILYEKYPDLSVIIDCNIKISGVILNNSMDSIDMLYKMRNYILILCIHYVKTPIIKDNFISNFKYEFESKYMNAIITNEYEIYNYYKSYCFEDYGSDIREINDNFKSLNTHKFVSKFCKFKYIYNFLSLLKPNTIKILSNKTPNDIALILIKFSLLLFNKSNGDYGNGYGDKFFSDPLYDNIIKYKNALNIYKMPLFNDIITGLSTKFNTDTNEFKNKNMSANTLVKPLNRIYKMVVYLYNKINITNPLFIIKPFNDTHEPVPVHVPVPVPVQGGFRNKRKRTVKNKKIANW